MVKRILYRDIHNLGEPYRFIYPTHQMAVKKLIDKLPKINVEKIILFGSLLDYSAGQGSDIDIAIISEDYPEGSTLGCWNIDGFPVDILIITPNELEENKNVINSVYYDIHHKGEIMYGR